jgi:hypothetical protein
MTTAVRKRWLAMTLLVWVVLACGAGNAPPRPAPLPRLPPTWHVAASALADVTGDDVPEWVLLVWRPWQDWPIQRWSITPSPIAAYHNVAGESCHLILIDPRDGREIWAGSALPVPFLALAVEDVDGDARNEVLTLEGSYTDGRDAAGTHVDVWRWNGFGFMLQWRSPPGTFHPRCLSDADRCGVKIFPRIRTGIARSHLGSSQRLSGKETSVDGFGLCT